MSRGRHANVAGATPRAKAGVLAITGALLLTIYVSQYVVPRMSPEAELGRERTAAEAAARAAAKEQQQRQQRQ